MNNGLEKKCIRINQNGLNLYVFILTSEEIHNNFYVSRRYENREEGYQRILKKSKVKNIRKYLEDIEDNYPAVLPNSILIALDNIEYDKENQIIKIKDNENGYKGLIIDGQHRSEGAYLYDSLFPLVVIGISDLEMKYQARLFITINDTQTKLPKSLYKDLFILINDKEITKDLLDNEDEIDVDTKAVEMARELTENSEYVLYNKIDMTGEKQIGSISLMEFVRNIKPYVNYDNGKFKEFSFMQQIRIVDNYFRAIKNIFKKEWEKDNQPIFKTTIFGGLLKSLGDIWDITIREKEGKFKPENIEEIFKKANIVSLEELAHNLGGGFKAQENYYKKFIKSIKDSFKEENIKVEL